MRVDNTNPTGSITAPLANANVNGTVSVTSDSADAGSGVASAVFQRSPAGAGTWTTISTDTTAPYSASWDTTAVTDGQFDLRVVTTDIAGNSTASAVVANVRVDNTAPSAVLVDPGTPLRGTVALSSVVGDGGSGVATTTYQYSHGGASSWTSTPAAWDTTALADGLYDLRVVVTDNAGNSTASAVVANVRVDNTAPSASLNDPGSPLRGTVTLSSSTGDGGSGVASVTYQYSPAGAATWSATPAAWDTTALGDGLYDLRVVVTDNAGNSTASAVVANVRVDNTAPSASLHDPGSPVRGTVMLSSSSNDAGSGIDTMTFQVSPAGAATWSATPAAWDTTALADGLYDLRVVVTDDAGNSTASATVADVRVDNTAPSATMNAPGSPVRGTVALSSNTADAGSGIASVTYQYSHAGAGSWTSTPSTWDTTAVGDGLYDLRVVVTDNAGNSTTSAAVTGILVDNTDPTGSITTPLAGDNVRGTVTVASDSTDGGSDVASAVFQRSPAGAGTWATIDTATGSPYQVGWDTTAETDGLYDLRVITTDEAGNTTTSATVANVRVDNTAPSASLDDPGSPVRGTVALSSNVGDGGSGVATTTYQYSHAGAGSWANTPAAWDTTALADGFYDLRVVVTDNAGNSTTSPTVAGVLVDNTAPAATLTDPGSPLRGTVTLFSTSGDGGSGVASTTYQYSPAGDGTWSATPAAWDTTALADGLYDLRVVVTDDAGNSTTSTIVHNVLVDNTAPAASLDDPGAPLHGTVTLSANATDGGSGIATIGYQYSPAGDGTWSATPPAWDTTALSDGLYDLRVVVSDVAGNSTASAVVANVRVDNTAPSGGSISYADGWDGSGSIAITADPGSDPGSGIDTGLSLIERQSATLTGTSCGSFSGPWTVVTTPDATVANGHCYRYRYVVVDQTGNVTTYTSAHVVKEDSAAPTALLTNPGANVRGTVSLGVIASDGLSGVDTVAFQRSPAGAGTWTTIGTATGAPYQASWDTTGVADGQYDLRAVATDMAGNTGVSATIANVRVDNTAPAASLDDPGTPLHGTVALSSNASDGGSGVAARTYQYSPAGAGTWTTTPASWDTTALADGLYDLRVRVTDTAGNSTTSAVVANVLVDNTAPTVTLDDPGSPISGLTTLSATVNDGGSGVTSVTFQRAVSGHSTWSTVGSANAAPWQVDWDTTGVADGTYDLRVVATDAAGNSTTSVVVGGVVVDNTPGDVAFTLPAEGDFVATSSLGVTTVAAHSTDATVQQVAFFVCGDPTVNCSSGDWQSLGVDAGGPFDFSVQWTLPAGDGNRALKAVSTDDADNHGHDVINVTIDREGPAGGSVDYADGYVSGAVAASTDPGTDAVSGVDLGSGVVQRQDTTLTDGGCDAWAGGWSAVSVPDSTVADGHCYRYRYQVADEAGNVTTYTSSHVAMVDGVAPSASLSDPGSPLSGTVTLHASASDDGGSGLGSLRFESSPAGAGTWTEIDTANASPWQVDWDTTNAVDGSYDLRVVATDAAGNSTTSALVAGVSVDNTPGDVAFTSPADGDFVVSPGPVTIQAHSDDTTVQKAEFFACGDATTGCSSGDWQSLGVDSGAPSNFSVQWTLPADDGNRALKAVSTDDAGNHSSVVIDVTIDRDGPSGGSVDYADGFASSPVAVTLDPGSDAVSGVDLSSAQVQRKDATLSGGSCGAFAGGWNNVSLPDASITDGHCYRYRYQVADEAGNVTTYTSSHVVKVDGAAPTVSVATPSGPLNGTVTLHASASDDGGSGLGSLRFESSPSGAGTWTEIDTANASPWQVDWDTAGVADGAYDVRAIATDGAENATTSAIVQVNVDHTVPPPPFTFKASKAKPTAKGKHGYLTLTVTSSLTAKIKSVLYRKTKTVHKWSGRAKSGAHTLKLSIPKKQLKKGKYKLTITATVNGQTIKRTVNIKVPKKLKKAR